MAVKEKHILNRLYLVAACLFLFAGLIGFKLFSIQFVQGEYYRSQRDQKTFKNDIIPANKGNLYDANHNLLATSVPKYEIRFDPVTVRHSLFQKEIGALSKALSKEFGKPVSYYNNVLREARAQKNRYFLIARNLGYTQYMRVRQFPIFNKGAYKGGLIVEQHTIRELPMGKIAERTIGYERRDTAGYYTRVGLEGAYGPFLRGKEGRCLKQKIAQGQWKPISDVNEVEPKDGYDVISTIDVNMQDIVHHALLAQMEKFKAEYGTAVVMDTKSGEVRAISNLGRTKRGKYYEKLNYAVGESQEPGSTFKLMAMVAALEDKVIDTSDVVDTENGRVKFFDRTVYDSHWGGYGKISMGKAFEVSSNTAFAKMVYSHYKAKPKQFLNRLYNMGLNKRLGVEIKGEGKPVFRYPGDKEWYGTTLPWMAFGYGVQITPLQTLAFYNAIANDGEMVKPRFIKEIKEYDNIIKKYDKEVLNSSVCSKQTARTMKDLMKKVVRRGTAKNIYDENFSMAGKTGTCQYRYWEEPGQYTASFVGYFPAENPEYSCIVVINKPDPKIGYYGNVVAAPVFKQIAHKIYSDNPIVDKVHTQVAIHQDVEKQFGRYYKTIQQHKTILPDVTGLPAMDAISILENMGLRVVVQGTGKVKEQSVAPGRKIAPNDIITIKLS